MQPSSCCQGVVGWGRCRHGPQYCRSCPLPAAGEGPPPLVPGGAGLFGRLLPVQQHSVRFHIAALPYLSGHHAFFFICAPCRTWARRGAQAPAPTRSPAQLCQQKTALQVNWLPSSSRSAQKREKRHAQFSWRGGVTPTTHGNASPASLSGGPELAHAGCTHIPSTWFMVHSRFGNSEAGAD